MRISVPCDCGKVLSVPETMSGKKGKCPSCGKSHFFPVDDKASERSKMSVRPPGTDTSRVNARSPVGVNSKTLVTAPVISPPAPTQGTKSGATPIWKRQEDIGWLPSVQPDLLPQTINALSELLRLHRAGNAKSSDGLVSMIQLIQAHVPSFTREQLGDRRFVARAYDAYRLLSMPRFNNLSIPSEASVIAFATAPKSHDAYVATPFEFYGISLWMPSHQFNLLIFGSICLMGPIFWILAALEIFVGIPYRRRARQAFFAGDTEALKANKWCVTCVPLSSIKEVSFNPSTGILLIKMRSWQLIGRKLVATSHDEAARYAAFAQFCSQYSKS